MIAGSLHHIGLTVPDLGQAVGFLTGVLGREHLFTTPPGQPMSPDAAARLNLSGQVACDAGHSAPWLGHEERTRFEEASA